MRAGVNNYSLVCPCAADARVSSCARSALVTIEMLKELERLTGQRVHELFDVIAGTSTGGILAAGIQERLSLVELEALYIELAQLVFTREPAPRRGFQLLFTGATYKATKLEAILKRVMPRLERVEAKEARTNKRRGLRHLRVTTPFLPFVHKNGLRGPFRFGTRSEMEELAQQSKGLTAFPTTGTLQKCF